MNRKAKRYFKANACEKTDISVIKDAIRKAGTKNVIMIADKGFGSDSNFKVYKEVDSG